MNMERMDYNAMIIMEIASTICLGLRLRQFALQRDMDFKFEPLKEQEWPTRKRKEYEEMDIFEAMDSIRYAIDSQRSDSDQAMPRISRKIGRHHLDDEGRCELVLTDYYNKMNKEDKSTMKRFKKKLGNLFSSCLCFLDRNELICQLFTKQRCPQFDFQSQYGHQMPSNSDDQNTPNFRVSTLCTISFYETKDVEKNFQNKRKETFSRLYANEHAPHKVIIYKTITN